MTDAALEPRSDAFPTPEQTRLLYAKWEAKKRDPYCPLRRLLADHPELTENADQLFEGLLIRFTLRDRLRKQWDHFRALETQPDEQIPHDFYHRQRANNTGRDFYEFATEHYIYHQARPLIKELGHDKAREYMGTIIHEAVGIFNDVMGHNGAAIPKRAFTNPPGDLPNLPSR